MNGRLPVRICTANRQAPLTVSTDLAPADGVHGRVPQGHAEPAAAADRANGMAPTTHPLDSRTDTKRFPYPRSTVRLANLRRAANPGESMPTNYVVVDTRVGTPRDEQHERVASRTVHCLGIPGTQFAVDEATKAGSVAC